MNDNAGGRATLTRPGLRARRRTSVISSQTIARSNSKGRKIEDGGPLSWKTIRWSRLVIGAISTRQHSTARPKAVLAGCVNSFMKASQGSS